MTRLAPSAIASIAALALATLATGACRAPKPRAVGEFQVSPIYEALFRPYNHWTYHAITAPSGEDAQPDASTEPDPDAPRSVVVKCRTDKVVPFHGGVTSHVHCDQPPEMLAADGVIPLEGVWMANDTGLWHVHAGAPPTFDNATLVLRARPEAGHVNPDDLTTDDSYAENAQQGDAWCTTHRQQLDEETYYTLCFAPEGVRTGRYGFTGKGGVETRFELAP